MNPVDPLFQLLASLEGRRISRRSFLKATGASAVPLWLIAKRASAVEEQVFDRGLRLNDPFQPLSMRVTRARDLMALDFEFVNLQPVMKLAKRAVAKGASTQVRSPSESRQLPWLHISSYANPAYIVIRFGGQHIAEEATWDKGENAASAAKQTFLVNLADQSNGLQGLAGAWLSGHSRLVFELPQDKAPLPPDIDQVLEMCATELDLIVDQALYDPAADDNWNPRDTARNRLEDPATGHHNDLVLPTRIEFPSLLYLSPYDNARWKLRPRAFLKTGRAELWGIDLNGANNPGAEFGRPRDVKRPMHMFPVACEMDRDLKDGISPADGLWRKMPGGIINDPKTSLYAATRYLLVRQAAQDNGDIASQQFRLTSVGATAELEYTPILVPEPKRTPTPNDSANNPRLVAKPADCIVIDKEGKPPSGPDGFLTEWVQKTELGRDYYVKEAFAGWWMPFGLRAEVVTITERLFCHRKEQASELTKRLNRLGFDVAGVQGNLTALLVARKFAVVRDTVREYGGRERDDFDEVGARLARAVGLAKVEVLVDRTPTLSNVAAAGNPLDPEDIKKLLHLGEDGVFVTGTPSDNADKEIFFPRIATRDAQGGRTLAPFKFPLKLTFHDGQELTTSFPMLFCYKLDLGHEVYSAARADLRDLPIGAKISLAPEQPAGAINAHEIAGAELAKLGEVIQSLRAEGDAAFQQIADSAFDPDLKKPGFDALPEYAAVLAAAVNPTVGGGREAAIVALTAHAVAVDEKLNLCGKDIDKLEAGVKSLVTRGFRRDLAWGEGSHGGVDAPSALQRLLELLARDDGYTRAMVIIKGFCGESPIDSGSGLSSELRKKLMDMVGELVDAEKPETPSEKLRTLQFKWVTSFSRGWVRADWDALFYRLAVRTERLAADTKSHCDRWGKRLAFLEAVKCGAWGNNVNVHPAHAVAREKLLAATCVSRDAGEMQIATLVEIANRLFSAVEHALPEDTWYRRRLRWVLEDLAQAGDRGAEVLKNIREDLDDVRGEIAWHVAHIATHVDRGEAIAARFCRDVSDSAVAYAKAARELAGALEDLAKPPKLPRVDADDVLLHVLDGASEQRLAEFRNLLHEGGGRLIQEFKDRIRNEGEGLRRLREDGETLRKDLETQWNESGIDQKGAEVQARIEEVQQTLEQWRRKADGFFVRLEQESSRMAGILDGMRTGIARSLRTIGEELKDARADQLCEWLDLDTKTKLDDVRKRCAVGLCLKAIALLRQLSRLKAQEGKLDNTWQALVRCERSIVDNLRTNWSCARVLIDVELRQPAASDCALALLKKHGPLLGAEFMQEVDKLDEALELGQDVWPVELLDWMLLRFALDDKKMTEAVRALLGDGEEALEQLETAWRDIASQVDAIQKKWGDGLPRSLPELRKRIGAKQYDELRAGLDKVVSPIEKELHRRAARLDTTARNMIRKAGLSLKCPSLLKSFQDQGRKATYHVEKFVLTTKAKMEDDLKGDLRAIKGYAGLEAIHAKVPGLDAGQILKPASEYVTGGFRVSVGKAPALDAGVFAELAPVKKAEDVIEAGVVSISPHVNRLSRELGALNDQASSGVAKLKAKAKKSLKELRTEAGSVAAEFEKGKTALKGLKGRGEKEVGQLVKALEDGRKEAVYDLEKRLDALKGQADKALKEELENIKRNYAPQIAALRLKASEAVNRIEDLLPLGDDLKLFGVLDLKNVLKVVASPDNAPKQLAKEYPDRVERTYSWSNTLQDLDVGGILKFVPEPPSLGDGDPHASRLKLDSRATIWLPKPDRKTGKPGIMVRGQLGAFSLEIAGLVKLYFQSLSLTSENGRTRFVPRLGRVAAGSALGGSDDFIEFRGALQFVDKIRDSLSSLLGGEDAPRVRIDNGQVMAGYALALPNLAFGAVAITDIRLVMEVGLPIQKGDLTYKFGLSERLRPFRVSVSGFAGGGFFAVAVSPNRKLCYVEGSIEFGGALDFSFGGVAEGGVYLMAGLYFRSSQGGVTFEGYIRAGGRLSVLGLINVSICFYLALAYVKRGQMTSLTGKCTIYVHISLMFFKKTVSISMEKTFAGSKASDDETAWLVPEASRAAPQLLLAGNRQTSRRRWATDAWVIREQPSFRGLAAEREVILANAHPSDRAGRQYRESEHG